METKTRIGVVVRLRPFLAKELKSGLTNTKIEINQSEKSIT